MKKQLKFNMESSSIAELLEISQERAFELIDYMKHVLSSEKIKTKTGCLKYLWEKAEKPEEAMFMAAIFGESHAISSIEMFAKKKEEKNEQIN